MNLRNRVFLGSLLALTIIPATSFAAKIRLRENSVIPVIVDDELSIQDSRAGDRFRAHVDSHLEVPMGTRLLGRVVGVHEAKGDRKAYMDLEFTDIELPNGDKSRLTAVPVMLSDRHVVRGNDGRFRAVPDEKKKSSTVLGGALGGFVIGSIFKKQAEGLILGTIAGIIVAETDKSNNGNIVITRGTRLGALVEKEQTIETDAPDSRKDRVNKLWHLEGPDADRPARRSRPPEEEDNRRTRRDDSPARIPTADASDAAIRYEEKHLRFTKDEKPFLQGETLMVPLNSTADQLDLSVSERNKVLYVEDDDSMLKIEKDSKEYRLNGKRGTLDEAIVEKDGKIYVPIQLLAELKSGAVYVDGKKLEKHSE